MKQFLILAALIVGSAFGQLRFSANAFYGDITSAQVSNYVLLGAIPAGAILTGIRLGEAVKSTNVECTNSIQIGIRTSTNYFLHTTQLPMQIAPSIGDPLGVTNGFIVLSTKSATPVYGYVTRAGALAGAAYGTWRVVIEYLQK